LDEQIRYDTGSIYQVRGDYSLVISSPHKGFATVITCAPGKQEIFPRLDQDEIRIEARQGKRDGPYPQLDGKAIVLVVVSESPATEVIRKALPEGTPNQIDQLLKLIEEPLWKAGHRWVAIGYMAVEPAAKN
jgi:hypothetical protein